MSITEWKHLLTYNARGEILPTLSNIGIIYKHDIKLQNIVFNELRNVIDIIGEVPWQRSYTSWSNSDFSCLQMYMEREYHIYSPRKCKDALYAYLTSQRRYHPVKEFFAPLKWDETRRLDQLLIDYLGAEDTPYVRAVTRKTFVAAVARIYDPGIKFDTMLVLSGEQGIGKSTLFSKMGLTWYSDSMSISDMKDKTAAEKLQGIWIMELSELAGLKKIDVETVKSFISRTDDQYRAPYDSYVESHLRTNIVVGTTNTTNGFLRDITGNRRFWPVPVSGKGSKSIWNLSYNDICQLWAEALFYYQHKESLYLPDELLSDALHNQCLAMEQDPRQGLIDEYLNRTQHQKICLMELWCECLGKERSDMKKRDAYELEGILKQIGGWKLYDGNITGKTRLPDYGVQKTFVRCSAISGDCL